MTPYELPTADSSRRALQRLRLTRRTALAVAWFFIALAASGVLVTVAYVVAQMLGRFA